MKHGDVVTLGNSSGKMVEVKIAGIVDNFEPYLSDMSRIEILLGKENMVKEEEIINSSKYAIPLLFDISIDTDNPYKIDEKIQKLNEERKIEGKEEIYGSNSFDYTNSEKINELSRRAILKIPLYLFVRINFSI